MSLLSIYDTTLRDGTQGEGISFSAEDKVLLAHKLDAFGIDYIEGGWPGSNPRDIAFFDLAKKEHFRHAKICAFGSTVRVGMKAEKDSQLKLLLDSETSVITIFGKTWNLHVTEVLRTTLEENLRMIADSIRYLKRHDREVIYDAEHFFDGYKSDPVNALKTLEVAHGAGADILVLCDTNGGCQIREFGEILRGVQDRLPEAKFGVHCHNDCGLGVALSIEGVLNNASMVQGTINGYGERIGNANLTTIIPNLHFKHQVQLNCSANMDKLSEMSRYFDRMSNMIPNNQQPFVGRSAFAHKGGVHANAAKKVSHSYEHMQPELVGNKQRILLSDMSGGSSIVMKAREYGIELEEKSDEMRGFLQKIKVLENKGYTFELADASFIVLLYQHFHGFHDDYRLVSYRTISEVVRDTKENISEAVIKLRLKEQDDVVMNVAESTGPVGALAKAARIIFKKHFPVINSVELLDYKVRILQTGAGTDSIVQVLMQSGDKEHNWWTCGANSNIIEASWKALSDSYRYKMIVADKVLAIS